jgi:hypothetical protein
LILSPDKHPELMQFLKQVVQAIKTSKEWKKVSEHKVGLALEILSQGQQSAVTILQQLYGEIHQSRWPSNDRAAHYWNNLEKLHKQAKNHYKS